MSSLLSILLPNNFLPKWKPAPIIPRLKIQWPSSALMIKVRPHVKTCRKPTSHSTALAIIKDHVTPLWLRTSWPLHLECPLSSPVYFSKFGWSTVTFSGLTLLTFSQRSMLLLSASILFFPISLLAFAKLLIYQALTPGIWTLLEGMIPVLFDSVFQIYSRACHPIGMQSLVL